MRKQVFTILGCSSSPGVPRINGDWGACDPNNPKNKRSRASFLIEQIAKDGGKTTIVVDTGPDFRTQLIAANVKSIDAVLYTHPHADHIHGIDDLRSFALYSKQRVPIYSNQQTFDHIKSSFGYCVTAPQNSAYPPIIDAHIIDDLTKPIHIEGAGGMVEIIPHDQEHGSIRSLGFRIGNIAYCTDVSDFPPKSEDKLQNLDVIVIDSTLMKPHPSHFSVDQAVEWVQRLKAKKAYLTHMHIPLDYETIKQSTPDHIEPAFDGLQFEQLNE